MQWFKHIAAARHDPFIFDLRAAFGAEGYMVYFATVEIYTEAFRPDPGWFLDCSYDFLKHELGIYHKKKLTRILDFIRSWPDVKMDGYRPRLPLDAAKISARLAKDRGQSIDHLGDIHPKWVVNLTLERISLLIPNYVKIMDDYGRRRFRQQAEMSEQSSDNVRQEPDKNKNKKKNPGPAPDVAAIFSAIARDCETLAEFKSVRGRRFPGSAFVGHCIKDGLHPAAIRDGTGALIRQWAQASQSPDFDPWAYALGTAKSCNQHYKDNPVDNFLVRSVFGGFFGLPENRKGNP